MRQLMYECEGARRSSILVIDYHEGGSAIGDRKAAEHLWAERSVVGAQIADEEDKDTSRLGTSTKGLEERIGAPAPRVTPLVIELERGRDRCCDDLCPLIDTSGTDVRQSAMFVLVFEQALDHLLPRADVTQ